jgi:hypothetical protein
MQKNVVNQKWTVFAFDETTNIEKTGDAANITGTLYRDGVSDVIADTNPTELGGGYYAFDLEQGETNGDNIVIVPVSATANIQVVGCPPALYTVPPNFPSIGIESDGDLTKVNLCDANTDMRGTDGVDTAAMRGTDGANTTTPPTASTIAAAVWSYVVENSRTALYFFRIIKAALSGKSSGGGTGTVVFQDDADSKARITADVDANGNRTTVTLDGS